MIEFQGVVKNVLKDFTLEVKEGEILVLLGQSGSGKTTALRLINRLIEPDEGTILFNGKKLRDLDPIEHRRHIGYAIQHIGLFPHMTVGENIGIVPELLGWGEEKIRHRVSELLAMVGLDEEGFSSLYPHKLSGGQNQRIGVARALAADPPVILMDEPFGALDPLLRDQLQNEFLEIQSKIQKTIVFVTHDLTEAVKMGDRIGVLNKGKLVQIAAPEQIIENPASDFVEEFIGKDKMQLMLRIYTMRSFTSELILEKTDAPEIDITSTMMDALAIAKVSDHDFLAIYDGQHYLGKLPKSRLIETLINTL